MFGVYIYSAFCIAPELFLNHGFVTEGILTSCSFDYISQDFYTRSFMVFMILFGFFIPLVLIFVVSLLILITVKFPTNFSNYYDRQISNLDDYHDVELLMKISRCNNNDSAESKNIPKSILMTPSGVKLNKAFSCPNFEQSKAKQKNVKLSEMNRQFSHKKRLLTKIVKHEFKIMRYMLFVILFYIIAWSPYAMLTLIAQFSTKVEDYVTPFTTTLIAIFAKTSTVLNPILFSLNNYDFMSFLRLRIFKFKKSKVGRSSRPILYKKRDRSNDVSRCINSANLSLY